MCSQNVSVKQLLLYTHYIQQSYSLDMTPKTLYDKMCHLALSYRNFLNNHALAPSYGTQGACEMGIKMLYLRVVYLHLVSHTSCVFFTDSMDIYLQYTTSNDIIFIINVGR